MKSHVTEQTKTMSQCGKIECPVCNKLYSTSIINDHVIGCLDKQDKNRESESSTNPSTTVDNYFSPPTKRQKVADSPTNHTIFGSPNNNNKLEDSGDKRKNSFPRKEVYSKNVEHKIPTEYVSQQKKPFASIFQLKQSEPRGGNQVGKSTIEVKGKDTNEIKPSRVFFGGHTQASTTKSEHVPLPELMRPNSLEDYVGQDHVIGADKILRKLMDSSQIPSIILWGPPGCGKTTLAKLFANKCKVQNNARFVQMSATTSGIADVKEVIKVAKNDQQLHKRKTILFIDEIHRFNKLQQDTFLLHVENGTITLVGATTENPSFQVNNALLSRCRVIVLEKLSMENITTIVHRALQTLGIMCVRKEQKDIKGICIEEDAVETVAGYCDGDARSALNAIEIVHKSRHRTNTSVITVDDIKEALQRTHVQYDRAGDEHYHCASALQKSIRGSDDNGAIYWMTRMWEGGEDPLFIARRLLVTASEDIGLADSQALPIAAATFQACQLIGRPECIINLAHCTTYLARAPKSNEAYQAFKAAQQAIQEHEGPLPGVPLHLRNASTKLMKQLGYGVGYNRSHNGPSDLPYLPKELCHIDFFNRNKK